MKKFLSILFFVTPLLFAQNFNGVRIYINPGHGGHDPANDRFIKATGYWESEGNLTKGLKLKKILEEYGATVFISRTQNRDEDDLKLSVISELANSNNVDYFHSIHSNGFNGTSNYTLLLYKEINGSPVFQKAKQMCDIMVNTIYQTNRTTAKYVKGDYSFLKFNLGVLRGLTMPGTLSEGSFHDYIPESWRLMNLDYRRNEAWAIARAFLEYFNLPNFGVGNVAGILRDKSKTVDYFAFSNTNDKYKPINNVKVTLKAKNKIYEGDDKNNGYFYFENLPPGNYKVIMEAENYMKDSSDITVVASKTVFADKFLIYDTSIPSEITEVYPNGNDSVNVTTKVKVKFSREMNKASVEKAFSISPNIDGAFKWNNEFEVEFIPSQTLLPKTKYEVTISTQAKSKWDVPTASLYKFNFVTNSRDRFKLVYSYPNIGQNEITTTAQFRLGFDGIIDGKTLLKNVYLYDVDNNAVNIIWEKVFDKNGLGYFYFSSKDDLKYNTNYKIVLLEGLKDKQGYSIKNEIEIPFKTTSDEFIHGILIDGFETVGGWKNPSYSQYTSGVDTNSNRSSFHCTVTKKLNGNYGARFAYTFTKDKDGVCVYSNVKKPSVGSNKSKSIGMWVLGDMSFNTIEYWFSYGDDKIYKSKPDTLNWTGWKLIKIDASKIPLEGERTFNSFVVRQTIRGQKSSIIYADDLQYDILTDLEKSALEIKSFSLLQNYPNPFNPSTNISFSIVEGTIVELCIYNLLGQKVCTLIDKKEFPSGTHTIVWEGKDDRGNDLSSGIYIYRINTKDGFTEAKKMLLLK